MGHPRPVSSLSAPVRLASSKGTCCFHASTASTANSGSVCSHARMASANPCATKNCADSAAHAMSMAATRIEGAVQSTDDGLSGGITDVERRRTPKNAAVGFLAERNRTTFFHDRMLFERGLLV